MTKLRQKLHGGTAIPEPVSPQPEPQDPPQQQPPGPPQRKLSAAEQAAADELRTRQRRGLLRRTAMRGEPPAGERFLTWGDLFDLGIISSKTQARRLWERGDFVKPLHLSERVIVFKESEVLAWMAQRAA